MRIPQGECGLGLGDLEVQATARLVACRESFDRCCTLMPCLAWLCVWNQAFVNSLIASTIQDAPLLPSEAFRVSSSSLRISSRCSSMARAMTRIAVV